MKNKKDLIAQISRNLADSPPPAVADKTPSLPKAPSQSRGQLATTKRGAQPKPAPVEETEGPRATGSGKQAAFWLDDEDRAIFHETGMLLYSQGIKPSHNLVLRAAIRMIPRDHRLVEKVRELIEKDGRKVRHQKK